jgi:hypothetical protein
MLERLTHGEATPIDLETIVSVQDNITGNCLCVLGDSMAAPVSSLVAKYRPEFDQVISMGGMNGHGAAGNGHDGDGLPDIAWPLGAGSAG